MDREWYRENINKILDFFQTSERGLTPLRVIEQRQKYGENVLKQEEKKTFKDMFISQMKSPLIYVLVVASIIVFFLGHWIDGSIIISIVLLNAIIGSIQEGKAQNTLAALSRVVKSYATVIREGKKMRIPDHELVPGDIIYLKDGDSIPADARLIQVNSLKVNESALTGESESVMKIEDPISAINVNTSDRKNMVFRGTYVTSGLATAIVVRTGMSTVIGKISKQLGDIDMSVPLKRNIKNLSTLLVIIVVVLSTILFAVGILSGQYEVVDMFITVVAIAVSAIPESLPVVVTLVLATGVWRMSQRNVLVKKLQAVEALGQAKVIALDKTGTITKNQMMVEKIFVNDREFEVSGDGYDPYGNIFENNNSVKPKKDADLDLMMKMSVFTSIANVSKDKEKNFWSLEYGDPTEAALLVLGKKFGYEKDRLEHDNVKLFESPFDLNTKHHTTINKVGKKNVLSSVGSPEVILSNCDKVWKNGRSARMTKEERSKIELALEKASKEGYRLLAFGVNFNAPSELKNGVLPKLSFVGFVGIIDAIRPEVKKSVEEVNKAGIHVVMITGDFPDTAKTIAEKVGIYKTGDELLTGAQMREMTDEQLIGVLDKVSVFARVTPDDKLRVIEAYKKRGQTIAMTGDGINDALSLVSADLGISMGMGGTEVAREASDIVLLDDKFGNIIEAAEEGRNIYQTIRHSILYLLSTNVGELLVIAIAIFFMMPLPLLATQIIWLNLVTDTFLVAALALDPKEKNLLSKPYKKPSPFIIDFPMMLRILLISILMTVGTLWMFSQYVDGDMVKAWTISLTVLTVFQWYNIFNVRSADETVFTKKSFENKYLWYGLGLAAALHMFAIYTPFMQKILKTTGLTMSEWGTILMIGFSVIVIEEIRKGVKRIFQ
jgi:Ca2+-transporting ATPase